MNRRRPMPPPALPLVEPLACAPLVGLLPEPRTLPLPVIGPLPSMRPSLVDPKFEGLPVVAPIVESPRIEPLDCVSVFPVTFANPALPVGPPMTPTCADATAGESAMVSAAAFQSLHGHLPW